MLSERAVQSLRSGCDGSHRRMKLSEAKTIDERRYRRKIMTLLQRSHRTKVFGCIVKELRFSFLKADVSSRKLETVCVRVGVESLEIHAEYIAL